jgi:response regulator NasT
MDHGVRSATPERGGRGRVLVVDDDRLVLATVSHGLAQAGFDVIDADNGDDAILRAREHRPQLALLDIRMEGKSGFDVAEVLRDGYRIPFIFLSAFADEATMARARALGAIAHLVKPLDVGEIVPVVEAALALVRDGAARAAPAPAAPAPAAGTPAAKAGELPAGGEAVALATGVLMHRFSLPRAAARQRLQRMAAEHGLPLSEQAERVLAAVEALSSAN